MALPRSSASCLRAVPTWIARPAYARTGKPPVMRRPPAPKSPDEYRRLREAGRLASSLRKYAGSLIQVGITTDDLDAAVHDEIIRHGAYPSPLNYAGFPKSMCTSLNSVLCHGIPNERPLQDGDLLKVDISVYYEGVHGDCCGTFVVGDASENVKRLAVATRLACQAGIEACGPHLDVATIGTAISSFASAQGYTVSEAFCGHGIGLDLHELPHVMHSEAATEYDLGRLVPGMVFTIEPILVDGPEPDHVIESDGWTARSTGGHLAAQHEEMVGITDDGYEVLT